MKRKRVLVKMANPPDVLDNTSEFIPGRLYFVTLNTDVAPKSTSTIHYFDVDTKNSYDSFYNDFGPLNLAVLYHYCERLSRKLSDVTLHNKKIVHYAGINEQSRVNAAFLIGAYAVIKLNFDWERAYELLTKGAKKDFVQFRDASIGEPYTISLKDCLAAVRKALDCGFFDVDNFDVFEYEHYERVENGDLNWIVPEKFIAFCGPDNKPGVDRGYPIHTPETYFAYFRRHNVTTIVRLNKKAYDSNRFLQAGFEHNDLFFMDGGNPNDRIFNEFLTLCEHAKGAIAVHCKAGLGRTGTLIACYIIKHYKFSALEAVAWIRICRPGSIIAHQQTWLQHKQRQLWEAGEEYRQKMKISGPTKHKIGIYGLAAGNNNKSKGNDNMIGIAKKVDSMEINDTDDFVSEENRITQGDRLNQIKVQRAKAKQPIISNIADRRTFRSKVIVTTNSPVRVGRILTNTTKTTTSTTTRVLTKRNELNESQTTRRCSQRKINASLLALKDKTKVPDTKCVPKKKENLSWLIKNGGVTHDNTLSNCSEIKVESTFVKRGKRTLALEKDKAGPQSVKVLRRSHGQTSKECKKNDGMLHLPSVKINKSM